MLEEARAEVAALTTRRDEIAGELGRLSGVIEALNVPASAGARSGGGRSGPVVEHGDQDVPR
jgi:hypothetical protein